MIYILEYHCLILIKMCPYIPPLKRAGFTGSRIKANPKVAVLIDNAVVSSGEAIAISFIGRENTKSFGSATCGKSTGNVQYNLSYNRTLVLTTVFLADRNRKLSITTYHLPG
jgi:hypothetical protein